MEEGHDKMSDMCSRAGWRGQEWMSLCPGTWEELARCLDDKAATGVTMRMGEGENLKGV